MNSYDRPLHAASSGWPAERSIDGLRLCLLLVLGALGALAVMLGALLILGLGAAATPYVPFFLIAIGIGTWVGSLGFLQSRSEPTSGNLHRSPDVWPTNPPRPTPPPKPAPLDGETPRHWTLHLHSGLGRAAVSATTRGGDELWRRWTIPPARPLGVAIAGPVPQSAYSPPPASGFVGFPARDTDLQFPTPGRARPPTPEATRSPVPALASRADASAPTDEARPSGDPSPSPNHTGPFTESELDAMFPLGRDFSPVTEESPSPAASRPPKPKSEPRAANLPFAEGPAPRGPRRPERIRPARAPTPEPMPKTPDRPDSAPVSSGEEVGPLLAGPVGLLPTLDSMDHLVALEALNPTPPHLRLAPSLGVDRARPGRTLTATSGGFRWHCTECSQGLTDLRAWVECPQCARPICRRCLTLSFLTGADGHCTDCHRGRSTAVA